MKSQLPLQFYKVYFYSLNYDRRLILYLETLVLKYILFELHHSKTNADAAYFDEFLLPNKDCIILQNK